MENLASSGANERPYEFTKFAKILEDADLLVTLKGMAAKRLSGQGSGRNPMQVEEKIFTGVTSATALASIVFLILSLVLDYWLFTIVVSSVSAAGYTTIFVLNRFGGWFEELVMPFMVFTGLLVVALWVGVGGFYSDFPLFLIGSLLLFVMIAPDQTQRELSVIGVAVVYLVLVILQFTIPEITVNVGTPADIVRFNVVSTGVIGILVGVVTTTFRRSHDRDRQRLRTTMAELNHRVKNNLNIVSALIHLKDRELGDQADLTDLASQVDAIAAMYQRLQDQGTVSEVNLGPYLQEILTGVFSLSRRKQVVTDNQMDDVAVSSRHAVTLGLLVNEIATNALKHGFGGKDVGQFRIHLAQDAPGIWVLTTEENGYPIPDNVDLTNSNTLGLQLVTNLSEQLNGSIQMIRKPHPKFIVRFPINSQ